MANRRPKNTGNKRFPPRSEIVLKEPVESLPLKEETANLLKSAGCLTLSDILKREGRDFYKIQGFKKGNLIELKIILRERGLRLKPPEKTAPQSRGPVRADAARAGNSGKRSAKPAGKERHDDFVLTCKVERPPKPKVVPPKEETDIYLKVRKAGLWGFKDRKGNQTVEPVYDEVFTYKEDLCCVQKDELFGFIDRKGKIVVPIKYTCAASFSEGSACVYEGEKCGYIDAENNKITEFTFDAGTPVIGGECRVKKDGQWGEMHFTSDEEGRKTAGDIRWITR